MSRGRFAVLSDAELAATRAMVAGGGIVTASGLTLNVAPLQLGTFESAGGSISAVPNGTWFVGIELSSKRVRLLPRMGHRGWIPVAKVVTDATSVVSLERIHPQMPATRIPRTMAKVLSGQALNVVVMGSSLTASGGGATDWPGMVFGAGTTDKYKVPVTVAAAYTGVGGSPNKYQLAQTGLWGSHDGYGISGSGFPRHLITAQEPPNGRSALLAAADLVVIGMCANGGDYATAVWEPLIRNLRKQGCEVVVVTDNPQGPSTDYATMQAAGLYGYGPELMRLADLYGVELADTAAYVFEAHLRAGGVGIYSDSIHMVSGVPAGPDAVLPANGHEAWARAVRSIFSIGVVVVSSQAITSTYDFSSDLGGWAAWGSGVFGSVALSAGTMVVTKTSATAGQWGAFVALGSTYPVGTVVRIQGRATASGVSGAEIGLVSGSWTSDRGSTGTGTFDVTVTATSPSTHLLLLSSSAAAASGSTVVYDDLTLTITTVQSTVNSDSAPGRPSDQKPLPASRICSDIKMPGDAFVIPAKSEFLLRIVDAERGVLAAHPWGSASMARRHSSSVGASEDLLVLATGKKAVFAAECCVGAGLIVYHAVADGPVTFQVYVNDVLQKTITRAAPPFDNDWWQDLYTPTELAVGAINNQLNVKIAVTAGTLKIVAGVMLTAEVDYLPPDGLTLTGAWLANETTISSLPARVSDTAGATASTRCTGRRLYWVLSGNSNSQPIDCFTDRNKVSAVPTVGNFHVRSYGGLLAPGAIASVKLAATVAGAPGNRGLAVGGAMIVHDR